MHQAVELVKEKGQPIDELSDAQRGHWREVLEPMIDKYVGEAQAHGVKDAKELYKKMQERVSPLAK